LHLGPKPPLRALGVELGVWSCMTLALLDSAGELTGCTSAGSSGTGGQISDFFVDVDGVRVTVSRLVTVTRPSRAGWTRGSVTQLITESVNRNESHLA
jgi:hypothetical protein